MRNAAMKVALRPSPNTEPTAFVTAIGWMMALGLAGFAVVNIVLETTNHFADSEYAEYATALSVMNWLVVGLKLLGAAVGLLSVTRRPPILPLRLLGIMVWSVFATLAVYVLGSMAQALAIMLGLVGSVSQINLLAVAYLIFFITAATGWGILAVSYSERHALGWKIAALGVLGAPIVLGMVLVAMPILLMALGLMPTSLPERSG